MSKCTIVEPWGGADVPRSGRSPSGCADDLPARLQAEVETFKTEIETLRGEALIKVADRLTGSGLSGPALWLVVEAKTKSLRLNLCQNA